MTTTIYEAHCINCQNITELKLTDANLKLLAKCAKNLDSIIWDIFHEHCKCIKTSIYSPSLLCRKD